MIHGTEIEVFDPRWSAAASEAGLDSYEKIIECDTGFISATSTTRVYHLHPAPAVWPGGVFLKKFAYSSRIRFFLRTAKPHVEQRNYRFLRDIGLNVPEVLAIGQRRSFGGLIDAFIITAGIENARSLEDYFQKSDASLTPAEMMMVLDQLADIVGTMHRRNFYHIDLQWRNVLIQRNPEGQIPPIRVFLIDCPRGGRRWFALRSWNGRMHDLAGLDKLAGLYLSPKDRLKWFKQYAGIRKLGWQDRLLIRWITRELESRRHE